MRFLALNAEGRMYALDVPSDDELYAIQAQNEIEERSRSPVWRYAKEAIALIGAGAKLLHRARPSASIRLRSSSNNADGPLPLFPLRII
jgi:hypothetical protein